MRRFAIFLALELATMAAVLVLFRSVEPKKLAAIWAGSLFVALGLGMVALGAFSASFRASWTFRLGCAHLFVTSLPLLIARLASYGEEFQQIKIWEVPGPVFHGLSEALYLALIGATLVDLMRARGSARAAN
jgi:hypothetical protein